MMNYDEFLAHFSKTRHRLSDEEMKNKSLLWDDFSPGTHKKIFLETSPEKSIQKKTQHKLVPLPKSTRAVPQILVAPKQVSRVQADKKDNSKAIDELFRKAFEQSKKSNGWAALAEFGSALIKISPSFKPSNYGFSKLFRMISTYHHLIEHRKDENNLPIIRVISSTKK